MITPSPEIRISDKWVHIYADFDWLIKIGHLKPLDRIDIDEAAKEWGVPDEIVSMEVSLLVTEERVRQRLVSARNWSNGVQAAQGGLSVRCDPDLPKKERRIDGPEEG